MTWPMQSFVQHPRSSMENCSADTVRGNESSSFMVVLKQWMLWQRVIDVQCRKRLTRLGYGLVVLCFLGVGMRCLADDLPATTVFTSGTEGYNTFRIPAIIRTPNGLLAFCEGRLNNGSDTGDIDIVVKTSTDDGATWSPLRVAVHDSGFTCGNPAPVYESKSGHVVLVWTKNLGTATEARILTGEDPPRTVWVSRSSDGGVTWTAAKDISASASRPGWRWYATGPCHAIQLQSGRLLVPANFSLGKSFDGWFSHVIYSDDGGQTWAIGGIHQGYTNESTVTDFPGGRVYQNMRCYTGENRRRVSYSDDGGLTWSEDQTDGALVEPVCQASVLSDGSSSGLLFSNPASLKRESMTVRWSGDGGKSWTAELLLHAGPSAYSDLVMVKDDMVGCLYERGAKAPYETIAFAVFPLARVARQAH